MLHCTVAILTSAYPHILWHTWRTAVRRVKLCGQPRMRMKPSQVWRNASWLHQEGKLLNMTVYEQVVESFVPSDMESTGWSWRPCRFCKKVHKSAVLCCRWLCSCVRRYGRSLTHNLLWTVPHSSTLKLEVERVFRKVGRFHPASVTSHLRSQ